MELTAIKQWKAHEQDAQVIIFKNAGHCVNMDVPDEFCRVMDEFWQNASERKQLNHQ